MSYEEDKILVDYTCGECHASGVKLWRQYQTFADQLDLMCCDCAGHSQDKDVSSMKEDGRYEGKYGPSDSIGWLVPAVPVENQETYWGYTSVPEEGVDWWRALPLR